MNANNLGMKLENNDLGGVGWGWGVHINIFTSSRGILIRVNGSSGVL